MRKPKLSAKIVSVALLRTLSPLMVFQFPLATYFATLVFDLIDGQLFFNAGFSWKIYNRYDKLLDYWWYIWIMFYFWIYLPQQMVLAVLLFGIRTIGQLLGMVLNMEKAYIYFPNILEPFFVITLLFNLETVYSLPIAITIAMLNEWAHHKSGIHFISKYIFKKEIIWSRNNQR